jgi:hypothetical protein
VLAVGTTVRLLPCDLVTGSNPRNSLSFCPSEAGPPMSDFVDDIKQIEI